MVVGLFVFLSLLIAALILTKTLNQLSELREDVESSLASVSSLMRQRNLEISELASICGEHFSEKRDVLRAILVARDEAETARLSQNAQDISKREAELQGLLAGLFQTVELNPLFKKNKPLNHIVKRVAGLNKSIRAKRDRHNAAADKLNRKLNNLATKWTAKKAGFYETPALDFDLATIENKHQVA